MPGADLFAGVRAVFTDLDGTLTTDGRLRSSTYKAIARLVDAGVAVVIVTGRPAGWGEAIARLWPVAAVVTENGGVTYWRGPGGGLRKRYAVPRTRLPAWRRRMRRAADAVIRAVPGARLSADSIYTEVDLAIDWNEEARLAADEARRIEALLRRRGFQAVRSSVHVNFWPPGFDKLTACRRLARDLWASSDLSPFLYVGDALNDEPMFRGFPRSVGVANVRRVWDELRHKPTVVTRGAEGAGFEEVAAAVVRARASRRAGGTAAAAQPVGRRAGRAGPTAALRRRPSRTTPRHTPSRWPRRGPAGSGPPPRRRPGRASDPR